MAASTDFAYSSAKPAGITPHLMFTSLLAATGGMMYAYDLVIAGGVSIMSDFQQKFYPSVYKAKLNPNTNNYCKYDDQAFQLFSSCLFLSALVATFFASSVTKNYGRKASMIVASLFFIGGTILGSAAQNLTMLITGRALLGCGLGFSNQAVPLYLSEIAPPSWRGAFNMFFIVNGSIGGLLGNIVNYAAATIHPWGWRLSLGLAGVPAMLFAFSSLMIADTPTSLIHRGKNEQAKATLRRIRGTAEIDSEYSNLVEASKIALDVKLNPFRNLLKSRNRPQLVFAVAFPFFQQVAGNDAIIFYGPLLFKLAGFQDNSALYSAVILGLTGLFTVFMAMLVVDRLGRKVLLVGGAIVMCGAMASMGIIFAVALPTKSSSHRQLSHTEGVAEVFLVCMFVMAFACSWGPLSWVIPSEIYPQGIRSAGQSVTVCVNMLFKFVIAQTFLSMLCHFKYGAFFMFVGWVVVMGVFAWLLVPETKGIALDDMVVVWQKHWYWKVFVEGTTDESHITQASPAP